MGEAADGREVLDKMKELDADVVLLDLWMPKLDGKLTLQAIAQLKTHTRVIVLTASEDKNPFLQQQ